MIFFLFFVSCISDDVSLFHICSQLFYPHLAGALVLFPEVTGKKKNSRNTRTWSLNITSNLKSCHIMQSLSAEHKTLASYLQELTLASFVRLFSRASGRISLSSTAWIRTSSVRPALIKTEIVAPPHQPRPHSQNGGNFRFFTIHVIVKLCVAHRFSQPVLPRPSPALLLECGGNRSQLSYQFFNSRNEQTKEGWKTAKEVSHKFGTLKKKKKVKEEFNFFYSIIKQWNK